MSLPLTGPALAPDAGAATRRDRNKAEKRARIRAAARDLFHQQGFAATSIGQVARAAAVAEGTVFLYVARKEDLLVLALADELAEAVRTAFAAVDGGAGLVAQLTGFFTGLLAWHEADPALARLFLREVAVLRDPRRDYGFARVPMTEALTAIVERRQAAGEVAAGAAAAEVARLCFALYWGTLRDWANEELDAAGFADRLRDLLDLGTAGLRPAR